MGKKSSRQRVEEIQEKQRALIARDPKARALRERMDDRSTDKYYRGSEVSAIGTQSLSDTTLQQGQAIKPPKYRAALAALDERNTDRYYRDSLVRPPTKQQIEQAKKRGQRGERMTKNARGKSLPPQGSTLTPVSHSQSRHPLEVRSREEVREAARTAVTLLNQGHASVIIKIVGHVSLGLQVRTILDGMVGRQELTEDQYRDIRVDVSEALHGKVVKETRTPDEIYGKPEDIAKELPASKADDSALDPEAFLSGEQGQEDDGVLPPELPVTEVAEKEDDVDDFLLEETQVPKDSLFDETEKEVPPPQAKPQGHQSGKQGKKKRR